MNLLLYSKEDSTPDGKIIVEGRRAVHITKILKLSLGDCIKVGEENGLKGTGRLLEVSPNRVVIESPELTVSPPEPWFDMILAMPRPRVFGRVLQHLTSLGLRRLTLVNCHKVEKSFFNSPLLSPESINENLLLGLEQAGLTKKPEVVVNGPGYGLGHSFSAIPEQQQCRICADPSGADLSSELLSLKERLGDEQLPLFAIGPEGGWVKSELESFSSSGFRVVSLGQRVLRVETAVIYIVALLSGFREQV